MHWLLYLWEKIPLYPLDRRLGRPQSWSGHGGKVGGEIPTPSRNQTPVLQLIA